MVKITDETSFDIEEQPTQRRGSEALRYVPYGKNGKWAIPLSKDDNRYVPALADWDSSSLNPEGEMLKEKFGGVVVISRDQLNVQRSENVSGILSSTDQSFLRQCIDLHGISYPIGTLDKDKI